MRYLRAYFDGSCEPVNPGGTGKWGFAVTENDELLEGCSGTIGKAPSMTNNIAEYQGLISLLKFLVANHKDDMIEIAGDSLLVVNMVNRTWGKKKPHKTAPHLKPLLFEAIELMTLLDNVSLFWIPREQNQLADYYSKKG